MPHRGDHYRGRRDHHEGRGANDVVTPAPAPVPPGLLDDRRGRANSANVTSSTNKVNRAAIVTEATWTDKDRDGHADGIVSRTQIDAALAYRAAYPDEIQARIELHRADTAAATAR